MNKQLEKRVKMLEGEKAVGQVTRWHRVVEDGPPLLTDIAERNQIIAKGEGIIIRRIVG